jgi:DnaK suppressor protein
MEELNDRQRDSLKRELMKLRDELKALLAATKESTRAVDLEESIGRLSRMDAMQQQSMQVANRSAAQRRYQQVMAALDRIAADEYGECLECGEDIALRRLEAHPEAPFCLRCQSQREQPR